MLRVSPLPGDGGTWSKSRWPLRSSTVQQVILVENMAVNYRKPHARKEITFGDGFTPTPWSYYGWFTTLYIYIWLYMPMFSQCSNDLPSIGENLMAFFLALGAKNSQLRHRAAWPESVKRLLMPALKSCGLSQIATRSGEERQNSCANSVNLSFAQS